MHIQISFPFFSSWQQYVARLDDSCPHHCISRWRIILRIKGQACFSETFIRRPLSTALWHLGIMLNVLITWCCNFSSGSCLDILCRIDENWEKLTCDLQSHGQTSTTEDAALVVVSLQRLLWVWSCSLLLCHSALASPECVNELVCVCESVNHSWLLRGGRLSMCVWFDEQRGSCVIS